MDLSYSKAALIDALNARIKWATALDKKAIAEHKKAEAAYLAKFKAACRAASQWDYAKAKSHNFIPEGFGGWNGPSAPRCPSAALPKLLHAIKVVQTDGRKTYKVTARGHFSTIHWLLTHDENAKPDVCA